MPPEVPNRYFYTATKKYNKREKVFLAHSESRLPTTDTDKKYKEINTEITLQDLNEA